MPKYLEFSQLLEMRIRNGDYALAELPTENELAKELGASRKTARRAIELLVDKNVLHRNPYSRPTINHTYSKPRGAMQLAFLAPAYYSSNIEGWRFAVDRVGKSFGATVRPIDFVHLDDPVIPKAIDRFDGVFFVPNSETLPPVAVEHLQRAKHLVCLEADLSSQGVLSLNLLPPRFIHCLGDHLYSLGHRHIDCFNTQPFDHVIQQRAEQWSVWQRMHGGNGRFVNEPVQPYEHPTPKAYAVMKGLLTTGEFKATAIVCLTNPAAQGVTRALQEHGLQVGKDVSVCVMEQVADARFQWPSRTVIEEINPDLYIQMCVDWFSKRTDPWNGPLLIEPSTVSLLKGESTGPAPRI